MSENRDPAIKLFGKTILLHSVGGPPPIEEKDIRNKATSDSTNKDHESLNPQEKIEPPKSMSSESSEQPSMDREDGSVDDPATEEQPDAPSNPKQKKLKKPDKILPCPRCKSMDTKFCYYNNYDINQPRHFCKICQRYWTAGGTMRNVPVGSGRRKNKNSASHCRHLVVTTNPSFQAVRSAISDLVPYTLKAANDTVLSFGSDIPIPGSVPSLLTVSKKNTKICNRNGFHHQTEDKAAPPCCPTEKDDEHSSNSNSEGAGTKTPIKNNAVQDFAPAPCLNGSPWTYSWIPSPPLCASSLPAPFYPVAAAYWSCPVPPGTLSVPWMSPPPTSFPVESCPQGAAPVPISPTLAKRSRDEDALADGTVLKKEASRKQDSHERCIWKPKALRVDDLEETARSPIRTMIGCKNGKVDAVSDGCLFKLFHPSDNTMNRAVRPSQLLHSNPAALSRSLNFQESS